MPSEGDKFVELVGGWTDQLRTTETIGAVLDNGDGTWTITASSVSALVKEDFVTINGTKYQVDSVDPPNDQFNITTDDTIVIGTYQTCAPYFYHGTPMIVDKAIQNTEKTTTKANFPAVILWHLYEQEFNNDPLSNLGYRGRAIISIVDTNNRIDWKVEQHYEEVINPMTDLADLFVTLVDKSPFVVDTELTGWKYTKHVNYGTFVRDRGHIKHIIEASLSGLNIDIDIPIKINCLTGGTKVQLPQNCPPVVILDDNGNILAFVPAGESYVCGDTNVLKGIWQAGQADTPALTIDSDSSGTYSGESFEGTNGTVTYEINSVPATLPFTLNIGDILDVNRTTTAALGAFKLTT